MLHQSLVDGCALLWQAMLQGRAAANGGAVWGKAAKLPDIDAGNVGLCLGACGGLNCPVFKPQQRFPLSSSRWIWGGILLYESESINYLYKSDDILGQFKYKKVYLSDVYSYYTVQYSSLWVFTHNSIYINISDQWKMLKSQIWVFFSVFFLSFCFLFSKQQQ